MLSCTEPGYNNTGSVVITCVSNTQYTFEVQPLCVQGKTNCFMEQCIATWFWITSSDWLIYITWSYIYNLALIGWFRLCILSELATVTGEITTVTVTQQKTSKNNEDWYKAAHAIDKDLSTASLAEPDNGEVWLKLEFDRTYFIHKIIIYHSFYTKWYYPD